MPESDRQLIESELGIPVLSTYQSVEGLRIAFQCEERSGFHIDADQVVLRIVDANGASQPPGAPGEVVISNLTNRATVLLNYRQGDVAALSFRLCPSGRILPMLESIQGRQDDLVRLPGGSAAHPLAGGLAAAWRYRGFGRPGRRTGATVAIAGGAPRHGG